MERSCGSSRRISKKLHECLELSKKESRQLLLWVLVQVRQGLQAVPQYRAAGGNTVLREECDSSRHDAACGRGAEGRCSITTVSLHFIRPRGILCVFFRLVDESPPPRLS